MCGAKSRTRYEDVSRFHFSAVIECFDFLAEGLALLMNAPSCSLDSIKFFVRRFQLLAHIS